MYPIYQPSNFMRQSNQLADYGPKPFVVDIEEASEQNKDFLRTLWTGDHIQLTLMSIPISEDIGAEVHLDHDQFIRIEDGLGLIEMGNKSNQLDFQKKVEDDHVILIPAGKWHNLTNIGDKPLKLYSLYAPPEHSHGTIYENKQ